MATKKPKKTQKKNNLELTEKQKSFCREYIIDLNATQAAIRVGYSEKTANEQGSRMLANVKIQSHISLLLKQKEQKQICTSDEVLRLLSQFVRGEENEECVVTEGKGDGLSEARIIAKKIVPRDRLKAMELMAKYHKLLDNKIDVDVKTQTVIFVGEDDLED